MKEKVKEYIPYIIIVIVVFTIRGFFYTPVRVNGTSMVPTLTDGEIMILDKVRLRKGLERFDIVVVSADNTKLIKRVIGLPGESVSYIDGNLYINEKKVDDKYAYGETEDFKEYKLADDEYFVMGDNREVSKDSRSIGPVKLSQIKGKANLVLFPFKNFGEVE